MAELNNIKPKSPKEMHDELKGGQQKQEQVVRDDYMFYNVMPKAKNTGQITQPTMKVDQTATPTPEKSSKLPLFFAKYKKIIILSTIVVILGIVAIVVLIQVAGSPYEEENLLVNNEQLNQEEEPTSVSVFTSNEWQKRFFENETCFQESVCGDQADPDLDGLENLEEFNLDTDPNNPDSDQDGLADGDEIDVFSSNPIEKFTAGNPNYSDANFVDGGYSFVLQDQLLTQEEINAISAKMNEFGLHQPTLRTLGDTLITLYSFSGAITEDLNEPSDELATSTIEEIIGLPEGFEDTAEAKQDRDAQRSNTIKKIAVALAKYYEDVKAFPSTTDFEEMTDLIKPYNKVATQIQDPINVEPFVYSYTPLFAGDGFSLKFYSETQNQIINIDKEDALEYKDKEEAAFLDEKRMSDLETLRTALLLYSNNNVAGEQLYVFPTQVEYEPALVPNYINVIPKDPETNSDYEYEVSQNFTTFTLKVPLSDPPIGTTGYLCNQEECRNY